MIDFLMIILEQAAISLPLALGSYISFSLLKVPDLSIESSYLFGALCAGSALALQVDCCTSFSLAMVLACAAVGGMLVGLVTACISSFGNIPYLLCAIISTGIFHGLFLCLSGPYQSLSSYKNPLALSIPSTHPELIAIAILSFLLLVLFSIIFRRQIGFAWLIFGQSPRFFDLFSISKRFVFISGILMANALAGIAGYLFAQTNNLIEINMGLGKALFSITALILGKACISSSRATILIPLCGTVLYFSLQQFLLCIGLNVLYFSAIQAIVILVILLVFYKKETIDQLGV